MDPLVVVAAGIVVVVGAIATYLDAPRRRRKNAKKEFPFQKVDSIFSSTERPFFEILQIVAGLEGLVVFAKVRLSDIAQLRRGPGDSGPHLGEVAHTYLDFVLCDRTDLTPTLVIELDDRPRHHTRDRQRDVLIESVCLAAGLSLFRASVRRGVDQAEMVTRVRSKIASIRRIEPAIAA